MYDPLLYTKFALVFLKRFIYPYLPVPLRVQGRSYLFNAARDLYETVFRCNETDLPPHRLNISGDGSFRAIGLHNLHLLQSIAELRPEDHVLDLGCGIGRTATAMTPYLASGSGSYDGIDIVSFAIRWCRRHIAARQANFHFHHANIYNYVYNPRGILPSDKYRFPFPDNSFDVVIATSLFTHLLPATVANYLRECSRTVQPNGRILSSWFLIDTATRDESEVKKLFPFRLAKHWQRSAHAPEMAVAYDVDFLLSLFHSAGLEVECIYHGGWSGRKSTIDSGQDIILAKKPSA